MAEVVEGYVEHIVYRNQETGYAVFSLYAGEEEITCVGTFPILDEGMYLSVEGSLTVHPVYGEQLKAESYTQQEPKDRIAMERYLGSGAIKGIGAALAGRIMEKFREDAFRIIEEEPERLEEVKGISERKAREIALQFEEKREMRRGMIFLQKLGISNRLGVKIYEQYGESMYEVLRTNPYRLAEDISGVGFRTADQIARESGIGLEDDARIEAGLLYVLQEEAGAGNVYLPEELLMERCLELLGLSQEEEREEEYSREKRILTQLILARKVVKKEGEGDQGPIIYSTLFYNMELSSARMLLDLNVSFQVPEEALEKEIRQVEKQGGYALDDLQREAVRMAAGHGIMILTGGPGTGKTTTINTILRFFEKQGMDLLLGAPTGRAAKRMTETTGREAQTIHRMLEISGLTPEGETSALHFERNGENPLEADVIIIDEVSMVDIILFHALLKAIPVGTRLILVGDANQLPSVGPGNVLKDIIGSKAFPTVCLTKIFRQAAESDIVMNAHKINGGEPIALDNQSKDFFLLPRESAADILGVMVLLVQQKLPAYVHADPYEIQVLTPMRKGELGVENLNRVLQCYLNPKGEDKKELVWGETLFREGDKVMQIKNNYQLEWEVRTKFGTISGKGTGIYNGDMGVLREINSFSEEVVIEYEEGKQVTYPFRGLDEIELAYAVTVHKSQGSEYPAVVLPILTGPRMLFHRNLLYTAVTRAKSCVAIIGSRQKVEEMIANNGEQTRYSGLDRWIREMQQKPEERHTIENYQRRKENE